MENLTFDDGIGITVPQGCDVTCSTIEMTESGLHGGQIPAVGPPGAVIFSHLRKAGAGKCHLLTIGNRQPLRDPDLLFDVQIGLRYGEDAVLLHECNGEYLQNNPHEYHTCLTGEYRQTAVFQFTLASFCGSAEPATHPLRLFLFRIPFPESGMLKSMKEPEVEAPYLESPEQAPESPLIGSDFDESEIDSMLSYRSSIPQISYIDSCTGCESGETDSIDEGWAASAPPPEAMPSLPMAESEPSPPPPPPQKELRPETVTAYLHAEMDAEVVLNHAATLSVFISREQIEIQSGSVSKTGKGEFETGRKLIVELIVQSGFLMLGDETGRRETDLPDPENPVELLFNLKASEEGEGTILVLARQGQIPIVKLELKPAVVGAKYGASRKIRDARKAEEPSALKKPLHQLWIREVKTENGLCYNYQIYSPELQIQQYTESVPFKGDRAAYIRELYTFIEEKWVASRRNSNDFLQELRAFGADLFDQLIPLPLQEVLWKHRNDFSGIQVISSEPFIPWELVHLKNPAKKGMPKQECFLGQLGITRWLMGAGKNGWPPESITVRKDGCRYVIPDYHQTSFALPAAAEEAGFLEKHFNATRVSPEQQAVRDLIAEPGSFDLLHFACHGQSEQESIGHSALLLNGIAGRNPYEPERFTETLAASFSDLEAPGGNRPLVTVNACQTGRSGYKLTGIGGFANAFLNGGAGAFIGALWSVGDAPARTFIETLYTAMIDGSNLSEAAIKARKAARKAGDATWLAYVVYGHPHLVLKR